MKIIYNHSFIEFENIKDLRLWMQSNNISEVLSEDRDIVISAQPTEEEQAAKLIAEQKADARTAILASDIVVIRCSESKTDVPTAWVEYREALRVVINNGGQLPTMPEYPQNT